jgi:hypothetical protein
LTVGTQFRHIIDDRIGGVSRHYLTEPTDINMRVPDDVRKCVAYLGKEVGTEKVYGGTAFFVAVSSEVTPLHFMYLVTAKHCADAIDGIEFWVRVNSKTGGVIELKADGVRWYRHPKDPDHVDVAVFPFLFDSDIDATRIGLQSFYLKEGAPSVGTGDEVFITGLFSLAKGSKRNMPIIRMGNIAMMPEDKIPVRGFGDMDAYLIEAKSSGGVSGAPVFVRETINTPRTSLGAGEPVQGTSGTFWLLGLMNGHWEIDPSEINNQVVRGVDIGLNIGIAIVVPAYKIIETLFHPELMKMRKSIEEEWKKNQQTSVLDSVFPDDKNNTFTKEQFEAALKKASRKQ